MTGKQVSEVPPPAEELSAEAGGQPTSPSTDVEESFARLLADVTHVHPVSVDADFFADLGADSLVMAHFCALVRKHPELPSVSMKDVYRNPTVSSLATAVAPAAPAAPAISDAFSAASDAAAATAAPDTPATAHGSFEAPPPTARGKPRFHLCGVLQLMVFLAYSSLLTYAAARGYLWVAAGENVVSEYLRAIVAGAVVFFFLCAFPVLVKWTLVGRWKPVRLRLWSLAYFRFWIVRTLVRANPLVLFVGSPLYVLYLRALGARIGPGVTVFSRIVPVCTDLLTIGSGSVIRKDVHFSCYRAHDGLIETGPVALGRDAVVGEASVLDIGTSLGDRAQLGHASSLHTGQAVPPGERWHGSPAVPTDTDFLAVAPARCGTVRRALHGLLQILTALLVYLPATVGGAWIILDNLPQFTFALATGPTALATWQFYIESLVASALLFFGGVALALLMVATVPRLLSRALTPDRVYPLYGVHYGVYRVITLLSNRRFLTRLFGDSSAIVHYLGGIGYDLSPVEQTGSNFGTEVRHETPHLATVGRGTMIADGLSINNADFSSSSFRVSRVSIGARNFLGNRIHYPSRGRTGDNCLLATKVMVPVDGEIREGVGLLGSPSFEIPRSVRRDGDLAGPEAAEAAHRLLPAKNRHNVATMSHYLAVRWFQFFVVTLIFAVAAEAYDVLGGVAVILANFAALLFSVAYLVLMERLVAARNRPGPLFCSIYDRRFWQRERYWKVPSETFVRMFNGTPFKPLLWRLLGVRIGRRVFDDGCALPERPMVTIGDECTLNAGCVVQCHSQEDGAFKSDVSVIGARCTLGINAFMHYGVTVADGVVLAPDSFLMKGESVPQGEVWGGNPARNLSLPDTDPRR
ncbi:Pls/PosA family non-ribosomal peptide synthetase [Streptomyces sp. NPDC127106]|uniref:Pls/PosA family non-ribosomal peptide synthetase n=1 Tax=Streptomyces sp. NPDC127106 TaxID=3345360 RepID=UPI0036350819